MSTLTQLQQDKATLMFKLKFQKLDKSKKSSLIAMLDMVNKSIVNVLKN
jgi:hypothetical protein